MATKRFPLKPRALLSVAIATLVAIVLPAGIQQSMRVLCAWNAGMVGFLGLTWGVMLRATPHSMRSYARSEDEGRFFILSMITVAACASLLAIGFMIKETKGLPPLVLTWHIILAALTIVASWLLVHTIFALHYAHGYYQTSQTLEKDLAGGLDFPNTEEPDYWDFLYFSFVIGMTSQVSDVAITSRPMRRLSLLHAILAFFFNTSLLALSINIMASLL